MPVSEASRLRLLRDALGMSQRELADEWEVSPAAVAKWEMGTNPIPGPVRKLLSIYEEELALGPSRTERPGLPRGFNGVVAFGAWILFRYVFGTAGVLPSSSAREVLVRQFCNRLASHRGMMMKLGQMAAFLDPVLSEAERAALTRLRERAKPMSAAEVTRVFRESLGSSPREAFASFSPRPHRCGSVGQVHRAQFEDRPVAVKVQYPDARLALRRDLAALKLLEGSLKAMWPAQQPDVVFDEIASRMDEEVDFEREAETLEAVRARYAHDERIVIPRVIRERTRKDVLTMEWCAGQHLDEWARSAPSAPRRRVAETLWDFYVGTVYATGRFNADPHPGNVLVQHDDRVAFVDFGRQKAVSEDFRRYFTDCTRAVFERDWMRVWKLSVEIGLVKASCEVHDLARQCVWFWLPNLTEEIRFSRVHCAETLANVTLRGTYRHTMSMNRDSVFVHLLHLASYSLLATLDVTADYRSPMVRILYPEGGAPAPFTAEELRAFGVTLP